jgi:ParB/RepB/Spo0J family partition protein
MSTNQHVASQPVLRTIPLSRIIVPEGHNPRERFDEDALAALTADVAKRGILQPIRVAQTPTGDYALIAGERRYRAAIAAALMEVPASVRTHDPDQDANEQVAELLEEAVVENVIREDLDPIEEARACQRLRELGRTVRGIAETLRPSTSRRAGEAWVKARLQLLDLPEQLHPQLADGSIPLGAVNALRAVAAIDPACAALVADQVGQDNQYGQEITWADVAEDPLGAVLDLDAEQLPATVYAARHVYPASRFTLTDKATNALTQLAKLHDVDAAAIGIRFEHPEFEQADALGAAHKDRWGRPGLIVGQGVADQMASDYLVRALKRAREDKRRREQWAAQSAANATATGADGAPAATPQTAEERAEQARAERAATTAARVEGQQHAIELGAAVFKSMSRVKVDARVLRILTSIDVADRAVKLARAGARYGFPGWVTETEPKPGKVKRTYLDGKELADKTAGYLAGAKTDGEIAGRVLALLTMAVLLDENRLVAQSNQTYETVRGGSELPWSKTALADLHDLAIDRLPEHLTVQLRKQRDAQQKAADRLAKALKNPGSLTDEQAEQAAQDAALLYGDYSPTHLDVRRTIHAARQLAQQESQAPAADEPADAAPTEAHDVEAQPDAETDADTEVEAS